MNDEGEMEALTNSEWSAIGMSLLSSVSVCSYQVASGCTPKCTLDQLERDFLKAIVSN